MKKILYYKHTRSVVSGFYESESEVSVTGMACSACSASVEKVRRLDGIDEVNVNLLTNSMIVEFDNDYRR